MHICKFKSLYAMSTSMSEGTNIFFLDLVHRSNSSDLFCCRMAYEKRRVFNANLPQFIQFSVRINALSLFIFIQNLQKTWKTGIEN